MNITAINKEVSKKAERRMTIVRGYSAFDRNELVVTPCLRIRGLWMYRAGFCPGDKIVIKAWGGRLVIRKESSHQLPLLKQKPGSRTLLALCQLPVNS